MQLLGFDWYWDLLDAMNAAGLRNVLDEETQRLMSDSIDKVFGGIHDDLES